MRTSDRFVITDDDGDSLNIYPTPGFDDRLMVITPNGTMLTEADAAQLRDHLTAWLERPKAPYAAIVRGHIIRWETSGDAAIVVKIAPGGPITLARSPNTDLHGPEAERLIAAVLSRTIDMPVREVAA